MEDIVQHLSSSLSWSNLTHISIKLSYYFQNTSTIFLKANLEYLRGNYEKAIQFLNSKMKENLDFKYVTYIN